jgi:hypothetical protein
MAVLMPHLVRSVIFLVPVVISMVVWMIGIGFGVLGGMGMVGGGGFTLGPDIDSGLTVIGVAGIAFFGLIWFASLFAGVREVVDEGSVLVEGAEAAQSLVTSSIEDRLRQVPDAIVHIEKLEGHPVVRIKAEREHALVMVRVVGADLRIGWTMWRSRSTIALATDLFPGRRGGELAVLHQDITVAMREAVAEAVTGSAGAALG